jgi:preprotein translocase subunit SecG
MKNAIIVVLVISILLLISVVLIQRDAWDRCIAENSKLQMEVIDLQVAAVKCKN